MTITTTSIRRPRAFVAVAAAALLLPALLTACSGTPKDDATTAGGGGGEDKAVSLAACMREKGYDMPDPAGADKTIALGVPDGVDPDQWQTDLGDCTKGSTQAGDGPQRSQEMPGSSEAARKAAECLRENGFADYPDDDQASYRPSDPEAFAEVAQRCSDEALDELGAEAGK